VTAWNKCRTSRVKKLIVRDEKASYFEKKLQKSQNNLQTRVRKKRDLKPEKNIKMLRRI
jgi:hypothetical protein